MVPKSWIFACFLEDGFEQIWAWIGGLAGFSVYYDPQSLCS
jgi:hypothetical protein